MSLKVCILNGSYEKSDSPFKDWDPELNPGPYIPECECELHEIDKARAVIQLRELAAKGFDVFINLCDGAWDEDRAGIEVVQALERLNVPYTGAHELFYDPTREMQKLVCSAWGIPTPGFVLANRVEEYKFAVENLSFPMIVKHPVSYGSIGLTKKSRVSTPAELKEQVEYMISKYGGALIEEFIEGREYSVLVAEDTDNPMHPTAYAPVEYKFPEGETFKHFDMKWIDWEGMNVNFCEDPTLDAKLRDMSRKMFVGLGGRGYGRTDIRVNAKGEPFMLEMNPNCSIFYPEAEFGCADNILKFDQEGHRAFVLRIIKSAIYHHRRKQKKFKLMHTRNTQYGLYATEAIAAGEVIIPYEQRPQYLATKTHVEKNWSEMEKQWFRSYATPITDEVWMTWSNIPEEWRPLNHSCDPNAWLTGLDITARREIQPGEQITVDYATFCNEQMQEFSCSCGASTCRGTVRGTDYLEDFVARYGDHTSDYVRTRRKKAVVKV